MLNLEFGGIGFWVKRPFVVESPFVRSVHQQDKYVQYLCVLVE